MYWNKIKSRLPEIILLGAVSFLQFYRLGFGEIQSWDEARYVLRAEAIQKFGVWLDQTRYAIEGLYSSTHPPLIVWMMTISRMIFGNGVYASRLVAGISGVVAIFFFYKLAAKFFSRWTALFVTVSLGSAQGFLWFSHHAQFDIPMLAFIIAAVYYAIRTFEEGSRKFAIVTGILFACVLLSKAVQGLYLLPFILAFPYIYRTDNRYRLLTIILITFIVIGLPWYLYMMSIHPHFYGDYADLIGSLKTGSYAPDLTKQWWYYFNQTIINFPLLVLGAFSIVPLVRKIKKRDTVYTRLSFISFCWFVGMLIFLSSFHTRMAHFFIFLLLPASFGLCFLLEEFFKIPLQGFKKLVAILLLLVSVVWSGSELLRKSFREHSFQFTLADPFMAGILLILIAVLAIIFYKYYSSSFQIFTLFIGSLVLIAGSFYRWESRHEESYIDGAEQTANMLLGLPDIHSVALYHPDFPHESYFPQLHYYTHGALMGWDNSKTSFTTTWQQLDSLIPIDRIPKSDAAIVYVHHDVFNVPSPEEKDLVLRINKGLNDRYEKTFQTKEYQLYWQPKKVNQ